MGAAALDEAKCSGQVFERNEIFGEQPDPLRRTTVEFGHAGDRPPIPAQ
jgi:hypothetical protein